MVAVRCVAVSKDTIVDGGPKLRRGLVSAKTLSFVLIAAVQSGCADPPMGSQPETKSSSVLVDPGWLEQHVNNRVKGHDC